MPLSRYFLYIGGILLALLLITDAWLPALPQNGSANFDRVAIRIHSNVKWPDRIDFDTTQPPAAPSQPAADTHADPPIEIAEAPANTREAFAQLQPPDARELRADGKRPDAKPPHARKRANRATSQKIRLARQPRFDWFGFQTW